MLALSGGVLYLPAVSELVGQRFWIRSIHLGAAGALAAAPGLLALARPRELRALERLLGAWEPSDTAWLGRPWRALVGAGPVEEPVAGRFNAGQKLFAALIAVALVSLAMTGIPMAWWSRFGADLVSRSRDLHVVASFALLALLAGHVYLGLLSPYGLLQRRFEKRSHE